MGRRSRALGLLALAGALGAVPADGLPDPGGLAGPGRTLAFGFALVDVGWDDPTDEGSQTDYLDEVAGFTNAADLWVPPGQGPLAPHLDRFAARGLKAIVHVADLFFAATGTKDAPSGFRWGLRPDYEERWARFVNAEGRAALGPQVLAFYLGEEPTWNGIGFSELQRASDLIEATAPNIPVLIVEAAPALAGLQIPSSVDWVGFDRYFVRDPAQDPTYQRDLELLKSKRSSPHQKLVLLMDAHWVPHLHGAQGLTPSDLASVAASYEALTLREPDVAALLGYEWPGGFGHPQARGARNLPPSVREVYRAMGTRLIGRPAPPGP